jgi:hypothetical protein
MSMTMLSLVGSRVAIMCAAGTKKRETNGKKAKKRNEKTKPA